MIGRRRERRRARVRPVVLGREHEAMVEERIAATRRLVGRGDERLARRIGDAPGGYLLAHTPSVIVRHCEMLDPLPAAGETRVVVTPRPDAGTWDLDVATFDRPGLLAAFTGVLWRLGVDVAQAVLATWGDGAALQAFVVRADQPPDPIGLEAAFTGALGAPVRVTPVTRAQVVFDGSRSPVYTACEVTGPDEPGLLHAIASAMAAAGVDIHAARVSTVDGVARDHFDLSDRRGNKLDSGLESLVVQGLRGAVFA
jgi:[protein-PII] uridylyltransferase